MTSMRERTPDASCCHSSLASSSPPRASSSGSTPAMAKHLHQMPSMRAVSRRCCPSISGVHGPVPDMVNTGVPLVLCLQATAEASSASSPQVPKGRSWEGQHTGVALAPSPLSLEQSRLFQHLARSRPLSWPSQCQRRACSHAMLSEQVPASMHDTRHKACALLIDMGPCHLQRRTDIAQCPDALRHGRGGLPGSCPGSRSLPLIRPLLLQQCCRQLRLRIMHAVSLPWVTPSMVS